MVLFHPDHQFEDSGASEAVFLSPHPLVFPFPQMLPAGTVQAGDFPIEVLAPVLY